MKMEKRKRVEKEEEEERERLKTKTKTMTMTMKEGDKEQAVPTEEEVEEFYAIVRRMQEAMKYFEKGNNGGDQGRRFVEGRWKAVMESEKEVEDEDEGLKKKKKVAGEERVVVVVENNNGVDLDLNAEPVEIESST